MRKARRAQLEAALRARGLRASLAADSRFLRSWWDVPTYFVYHDHKHMDVQAAIGDALKLVRARACGRAPGHAPAAACLHARARVRIGGGDAGARP